MNYSPKSQRRARKLGADWEKDGLSVALDWRYDYFVDYLSLSPSYQKVRLYHHGKLELSDLPDDYERLIEVYKDVGDLSVTSSEDWWLKIGMRLFGLKAPVPVIKQLGVLDENQTNLNISWDKHNSVMLSVPLALTRTEVIKQMRQILSEYEFASITNEHIATKYTLYKSRLRKDTLGDGLDALIFYNKNEPLWVIGYALMLVRSQLFDISEFTELNAYKYSDQKRVLAIATSRLVKRALCIAENAARGIFPSDKPIKNQDNKIVSVRSISDTKRKAGRPTKVSKK